MPGRRGGIRSPAGQCNKRSCKEPRQLICRLLATRQGLSASKGCCAPKPSSSLGDRLFSEAGRGWFPTAENKASIHRRLWAWSPKAGWFRTLLPGSSPCHCTARSHHSPGCSSEFAVGAGSMGWACNASTSLPRYCQSFLASPHLLLPVNHSHPGPQAHLQAPLRLDLPSTETASAADCLAVSMDGNQHLTHEHKKDTSPDIPRATLQS